MAEIERGIKIKQPVTRKEVMRSQKILDVRQTHWFRG